MAKQKEEPNFSGSGWRECMKTAQIGPDLRLLILKQGLKEIREWGLFTEREGLMQMGRYHFQILWTLPFQFLQDIFDKTTRSQVKTLRGY